MMKRRVPAWLKMPKSSQLQAKSDLPELKWITPGRKMQSHTAWITQGSPLMKWISSLMDGVPVSMLKPICCHTLTELYMRRRRTPEEIGRASCRERVWMGGGDGAAKNKRT